MMPKTHSHRGGKKGRKLYRNLKKCAWYKTIHRREHNKIKKVSKHLKRHPNDKKSESVLLALRRIVY